MILFYKPESLPQRWLVFRHFQYLVEHALPLLSHINILE